VNLSPARLAVIVALIVGGIAVLINGFGGGGDIVASAAGSASPTVTVTPTVSPTATSSPTATDKPKPKTKGVTMAVFNGTSTTGLGATVQQDLEAQGYVKTQDAADAPNKPVAKTVVYYRGGADAEQNQVNAANMAKKYLSGAEVRLLGADFESQVPTTTQLVVVVGADYPESA
jgi:hypothetical protein